MHYLAVDGMRSGTGVRDTVRGGYIQLDALGLSEELKGRFPPWLAGYRDAAHQQFKDPVVASALDTTGAEIALALQEELPESKVRYFSSALLRYLPLT